MTFRIRYLNQFLPIVFLGYFCSPSISQDTVYKINDITQLNPVAIDKEIKPVSINEIVSTVKNHTGIISIGGGKFSMGGQTAFENSLHIDMRDYDEVVAFFPDKKIITVQSGITWREIQEFIDPYNLSVKIMQSYANFTVGGSLSVNVHGRYLGLGPIVLSVIEFKLLTASGEIIIASPTKNNEVFYGAIGGYGGLGIIAEVTLQLDDNLKVKRSDEVLKSKNYNEFFFDKITIDTNILFHNADLYPNRYKKVRAISYSKTNEEVTINKRLRPNDKVYKFKRGAFKVISEIPGGKWIRQHLIDPFIYLGNPVEWKNYEASYDVKELEPKSRNKSTYVLQEYFVPVNQFDNFYPRMAQILKESNVNVINVSIRHARKDPGTLLAWAKEDVFAFVIYYKQRTTEEERIKVRSWTRELVDAAIDCNGTYYLPYQIHATKEQFLKAYPKATQYYELKKRLDPTNKFRNKLLDAYYPN